MERDGKEKQKRIKYEREQATYTTIKRVKNKEKETYLVPKENI